MFPRNTCLVFEYRMFGYYDANCADSAILDLVSIVYHPMRYFWMERLDT